VTCCDRVVTACPLDFLAVVIGVAVVVFPRTDAFEPVGEKRRRVLRWTTHEQMNVIGLDSKVDYLQSLLVGNFVEDSTHTVSDLVNQYRVAVLGQPHYVVVEVVSRMPCGLHPYYTLCPDAILKLPNGVGNPAIHSNIVRTHYSYRSTRA
jgi:hypothetical protein